MSAGQPHTNHCRPTCRAPRSARHLPRARHRQSVAASGTRDVRAGRTSPATAGPRPALCADGDWLYQRDEDATFLSEENGFFDAMTPLVSASASRRTHDGAAAPKEDLFIRVMEALHKHWQTGQGTATECTLPVSPANCTKDGAVSYEPLLADVMTNTDLFQALHDTVPVIQATKVQHCTATNPKTGACTATTTLDGVQVLAQAVRVLVDPALNQGLTDRHGVRRRRATTGRPTRRSPPSTSSSTR